MSKLDPYKTTIDYRFAENQDHGYKQRHTAQRISRWHQRPNIRKFQFQRY